MKTKLLILILISMAGLSLLAGCMTFPNSSKVQSKETSEQKTMSKDDYKKVLKLLVGDWKIEHFDLDGKKTMNGLRYKTRLSASEYTLIGDIVTTSKEKKVVNNVSPHSFFIIYCDLRGNHLGRLDFSQRRYGQNKPAQNFSYGFLREENRIEWRNEDGSVPREWIIEDGKITSFFDGGEKGRITVVQTRVSP